MALLALLVSAPTHSGRALADVQCAAGVTESGSDEVFCLQREVLLEAPQHIGSAQLEVQSREDGAHHRAISDAKQSELGTAHTGIAISSWVLALVLCFLPLHLTHVKAAHKEAVIRGSEETSPEQEDAANKFRSYRWMLLIMLCIAYVLDMLGQTAFTASFSKLESDVGLSPDKQGVLILLQRMAMAASSILWAILADGAAGDFFVLGLGCGISSLSTVATAFIAQYGWPSLAAIRFAYGFGAGAYRPIAQSIISDCFPEHELGRAFGFTMAAASIGLFASTPCVAHLSDLVVRIQGVGTLKGWQLSFICVGTLFALYTLSLFMLAFHSSYSRHKKGRGSDKGLVTALQIPSCWLLVFVGACASAIVETHVLLVEWAQYFCKSSFLAGSYVSVGLLSCTIGSMFGGFLADRWADAHPLSGRISLGSVGTTLTIIFWIGLVRSRQAGTLTLVCFFSLGFTKMWGYVGTSRPLMMQLVSSEVRASFIAIVELIEGVFAALSGPFLVGLLAEHVFTYIPKTTDISDMPEHQKLNNLNSLGNALTVVNLGLLGATLLALALLYKTYPTDIDCVEKSQD